MSGSTAVVYVVMLLYCSPNDNVCEYVNYGNVSYAQDVVCREKLSELAVRSPKENFKCKIIPEDIVRGLW